MQIVWYCDYDNYFSHEPVRLFTVKEAIDFVHQYHGIACLAHPWLCSDPTSVCKQAIELGIDGLECFPPKHHESYGTEEYVDIAKEHHLVCSSGSDFHSEVNCEVDVGENVYPKVYAEEFLCHLKKQNIIYSCFLPHQ